LLILTAQNEHNTGTFTKLAEYEIQYSKQLRVDLKEALAKGELQSELCVSKFFDLWIASDVLQGKRKS
jgi:hypothetical protein